MMASLFVVPVGEQRASSSSSAGSSSRGSGWCRRHANVCGGCSAAAYPAAGVWRVQGFCGYQPHRHLPPVHTGESLRLQLQVLGSWNIYQCERALTLATANGLSLACQTSYNPFVLPVCKAAPRFADCFGYVMWAVPWCDMDHISWCAVP